MERKIPVQVDKCKLPIKPSLAIKSTSKVKSEIQYLIRNA